MSLRQFLRQYRPTIDAVIRRECPNVGRLNDRERRLWVLNHEPLYDLARACGVKP